MNHKPLIAAGTLMGIGMGGFLDGIIFHQILQFHSMLSAKLPQNDLVNVKTSMIWDGIFHSFTGLLLQYRSNYFGMPAENRHHPYQELHFGEVL